MSLDPYRAKRDFAATPEPRGRRGRPRKSGLHFVIQMHAATRLHYDLRLEWQGVMKSWAVTRGPSLDPADKRLAVATEDHPLDYAGFEGVIPKGQYGAGRMIVWDRGLWTPIGDAERGLAKGHLEFSLAGEKLTGRWHLVRLKDEGKRENWLLMKADDESARPGADILAERPESVLSGRSIDALSGADRPAPPAARTPAGKTGRKAPPAAPLPDFLAPMLAEAATAPPAGAHWLHEVKFDGYRLQARLDHGRLRLLTRSGLDWTERFAGPMTRALTDLPAGTALIDGEVVVEGAGGASDFSALQAALSAGETARFVFWCFDLMHLDGTDLTALPLDDRKARLRALVPDAAALRFSEGFDAEGATVLRHVCRLGLEGIISKDRRAPYRGGRAKTWLKSKCTGRGEFVIGGFLPSTATRGAIGSLVLGAWQDGRLRPVGRVGTGFSAAVARDLYQRLAPLQTETAAFDPPLAREAAAGVHPVRPELVAEVDYRAVTADGNLRHAVFRGLREDKPASDALYDLTPTGAAGPPEPEPQVRLTHPDRILWPDLGITKQGLADHYAAVWPLIAPHIRGRALAILRAPDGIGGETFFQKNHHTGLPDTLAEARDPRRSAAPPLIVLDSLEGLLALAQVSAVEIHPWGAPVQAPNAPDRLILDLDPGEGVGWAEVVAAALDLGEACRGLGLNPFVKTSGGKGLHIVCPLDGRAGWDEVKPWARAFARSMAEADDRFVAVAGPARRRGRIFIDWLRNQMGATAVAPWSPRARPEAGVSTPVDWAELPQLTGPAQFTMLTLPARLAGQPSDPWQDFAAAATGLPG